jgi:hypothetical protein
MTPPSRQPCVFRKVFSGLLRQRHGGHGGIAAKTAHCGSAFTEKPPSDRKMI